MLRRNWYYFAILGFIYIFLYPYIFDEKLYLAGDNAAYFALAQGLANEMQYVSAYAPIPTPSNHFPPGYPTILAIALKLGFESLASLKILNGIFFLGAVILTFMVTEKLTKSGILGFLIALAMMFNGHLLQFSTITMSEIPFLFFLMWTFYHFICFAENNHTLKSRHFVFVILGSIALVYIRTQGIAIIGAIVFYLLINKQLKATALLVLFFIVGYLPWQLRSNSLGGSPYVKQLLSVDPYQADSPKMKSGDWVIRISNNAKRYLSKEIPSVLHPTMPIEYMDSETKKPSPSTPLRWIAGTLILTLTVYGAFQLKQYRWLLLSFLGANFLIFLLWPDIWYGIRFIIPLTGIIILLTVYAVLHLLKRMIKKEQVNHPIVMCVVVLPLLLLNIRSVKNLHINAEGSHESKWANYLLVGEWAKDNLKPTDVVVCRKPELFYVTAGTKAMTFPYSEDKELMEETFKKNGATHVVLEQIGFTQTTAYLYPFLLQHPDRFELLYTIGAREYKDKTGNKEYSNDGVWLYRYDPSFGFDGTFKDGKKNGPGTYRFKNGNVMRGNWINDTLNGDCEFYIASVNTRQVGRWENDMKQGKFIIYVGDDQIFEAYYHNDVIRREGYLLDSTLKRIEPTLFN